MKHGDKAKAKSAKAVSKASGVKSSSKVVAKGATRTAGASGAAGGKAEKARAAKDSGSASAPKKERSPSPVEAPRAAPRSNGDAPGFANPLVASAFKRAVKKYPVALKRLTD